MSELPSVLTLDTIQSQSGSASNWLWIPGQWNWSPNLSVSDSLLWLVSSHGRKKTRRSYKLLFFFFLKTTISCTHMVNSQNTGVSAGLLQSSRNLQWYVHFNISDEPLHDQSCRDNRLKVGLIHGNTEYYCPSTWHLVSQWQMPFKWPPVTVPLTHQLKSPVALLDLWPPVVIMHRINCCAAHPYTTAYIKLHQNQSWRK